MYFSKSNRFDSILQRYGISFNIHSYPIHYQLRINLEMSKTLQCATHLSKYVARVCHKLSYIVTICLNMLFAESNLTMAESMAQDVKCYCSHLNVTISLFYPRVTLSYVLYYRSMMIDHRTYRKVPNIQ